jgi:hypothetical protein
LDQATHVEVTNVAIHAWIDKANLMLMLLPEVHALTILSELVLKLQKLIYVLNLRSLLHLIEYLWWELVVIIEVVDLLRYDLRLHIKLALLLVSLVQKLCIAQIDLKLVAHLVSKIF